MRRINAERLRRFRLALGIALLLGGMTALWVAPQRAFADVPHDWILVAVATLLITYRNYIEVNPAARRVAHRIGFGYAPAWTTFDTGGIRNVEIKSVTRKSGKQGKTVTVYAVDIKGVAGGNLCEREHMLPARLIAERVARALNVPLENRLFGGRSVRKPEDLDVPLAERWRLEGVLKEAPVIGANSSLEVRHLDTTSEISTPVPDFPRAIAALVGLALVAGIALAGLVFDLGPFFAVGFSLPIIGIATTLILRHSGRDILRFDASAVEFRQGRLPSRQRMNIAAIEEILVHGDRLVLMGDREHILIRCPRTGSDRALLLQFVERQVSQRQGSSSVA